MSGAEASAADAPDRVIFACVHNAGRSQMAAALFNALADPARARATSAGTQPAARVHPPVVAAMRELGADLSGATPQRLSAELARGARLLVTMGCGEACPVVPGLETLDWPLRDPRGEELETVREIRDEISARVAALVAQRGWAPLPIGERASGVIRPARASDAAAMRALLAAARLAADDVTGAGVDDFVVAERDGLVVGLAGLERHGDAGLLRSVAVSSGERGRGVGAALVADRLARARSLQLAEVHLLTRDAAAYFGRFGFVVQARDAAPPAVRRSGQFSGASCSAATAMVLSLRS